ncbi:MAG: hypothetical protein JXO72_14875 [Vicinamibacteria bacterium]|nr:hypothetical protein [Vicinamibacteria bacterium]
MAHSPKVVVDYGTAGIDAVKEFGNALPERVGSPAFIGSLMRNDRRRHVHRLVRDLTRRGVDLRPVGTEIFMARLERAVREAGPRREQEKKDSAASAMLDDAITRKLGTMEYNISTEWTAESGNVITRTPVDRELYELLVNLQNKIRETTRHRSPKRPRGRPSYRRDTLVRRLRALGVPITEARFLVASLKPFPD